MTIPSALSRWWHGGTDPADEHDSSTTNEQVVDRDREADRAVVHFHGPVRQPANVRAFEDVLRKVPPIDIR